MPHVHTYSQFVISLGTSTYCVLEKKYLLLAPLVSPLLLLLTVFNPLVDLFCLSLLLQLDISVALVHLWQQTKLSIGENTLRNKRGLRCW